jgi:hypothetical protein
VPPGQRGEQVRRDLRAVGERLVVQRGQLRHHRQRLVGRDAQLGVIGAQRLRHCARVRGLVEGRIVEADGEGTQPLGRRRAGEGHHQRRVDAAGQEGAERHVGRQVLAHDALEQRLQFVDHLVRRPGRRARPAGARDGDGVPVPTRLGAGVRRLQRQRAAGRELAHSGVDRPRPRHVVEAKEVGHRARVEAEIDAREAAHRTHLGAEHHTARHVRVVQRLDPEPVAHQVQRVLLLVPEGEGEHAGEARQGGVQAPCVDGCQQHLGVRVPAPAPLAERRAQLRRVVDLAVVDDAVPPAGRHHRLRAVCGQVHDRQPPMSEAQPDGVVEPRPARVGAAVVQRLGDRGEHARRVGRAAARPEPCDPAHASVLFRSARRSPSHATSVRLDEGWSGPEAGA